MCTCPVHGAECMHVFPSEFELSELLTHSRVLHAYFVRVHCVRVLFATEVSDPYLHMFHFVFFVFFKEKRISIHLLEFNNVRLWSTNGAPALP